MVIKHWFYALALAVCVLFISIITSDDSAYSKNKTRSNQLEKIIPSTPYRIPNISIYSQDAEGNPVEHKIKDYRGNVVLLNFWATWCAPCVIEMPELDKLAFALSKEELADLDIESNGIKIIPLSVDFKGYEVVKAFYDKYEFKHLEIALDHKNEAFKEFNINSLPTTLIINPKGREVARIHGIIDWNAQEVKDYLLAVEQGKDF